MGNRSYRRRGVRLGETLLDLMPQSLLNMPPPDFFGGIKVNDSRPKPENKGVKKKNKVNLWPIEAFFITFATGIALSFFSETTLLGVTLPVAIIVLFVIILVGIVFDIVGTSVTLETETAYTAMASKRIAGAKQAMKLVRNAHRVSNVCNDIVGDICGIVSGAMGAAISIRLLSTGAAMNELWLSIIISALIAAITVSGKACGKLLATSNSREIVFFVGKIAAIFELREKRKVK